MNNIDILEEKEKRLRAYLAVLNEENILYKKEDAIEGIIKLFEILISENKELKENSIPKSKVKEKIEEFKEIRDNILQNEYYKKEIEKYKKLAGRIENQIELLEKEKRDFLFIDNTECEYFKSVSDTLECLKRIYFNY